MQKFVSAVCLLALVSACTAKPENVKASYVSRSAYTAMSCPELDVEAVRVANQLQGSTADQSKARSNDVALTAVSLILFWPAAFFVGRGGNEEELGRLKGEVQAIDEAGRLKGCRLRSAA